MGVWLILLFWPWSNCCWLFDFFWSYDLLFNVLNMESIESNCSNDAKICQSRWHLLAFGWVISRSSRIWSRWFFWGLHSSVSILYWRSLVAWLAIARSSKKPTLPARKTSIKAKPATSLPCCSITLTTPTKQAITGPYSKPTCSGTTQPTKRPKQKWIVYFS